MIPPLEDGSREEGGLTIYQQPGELQGSKQFIYDAAMKYCAAGVPTVVFAGEEYGTGSSRDWAAKGELFFRFYHFNREWIYLSV